jgi:two-component system, response regulator / RNA-binding antiterminator
MDPVTKRGFSVPFTPDLTTWRHDESFSTDETPVAVLDSDLVIRAVNPAYEKATGFAADSLLSRYVFEAFPASCDDPDSQEAQRTMVGCYEQVMREGRQCDLVVQRYDVPDVLEPARFVTKVWAPVTLPVWHDDSVVGLQCRVPELKLPPDALRVLAPLREDLRRAAASDDPFATKVSEVVTWGLHEYASALVEVEQLREALTSRATIDQAKGILMAQHGCSPEEAFGMLVRLSNDTNVRLADVASALVYQTAQSST